ncbi:hypothetical protein SAMN05443661_1535 [Natronobacterium gregoryi]|uniref:Uncharacterized protein n=2 Tax=Natronobacterium gregoryi TaxID=44930 RepID=L0AJZ0_NATGS|nr:hypothetical protein Natgr_2619 [Natronobacterium gregoryi SP2]ELY65662.1 hypothetical protein C490_13645 [Natronobacterium gregoryi SP2]PLK18735.1 hypothetical protein CYV19_17295 [Natronobacterium gregoryi SP2]SFJ65721.1 hypothetical protein SAMN05443661_1535 [Natronobacterium gregoryi]
MRGVHPRVELPNEEYEEWLDGNQEVEYVVINFSDAKEVVERDDNLSHVLEPWHIPVLLGTEHDDKVNKRTLQDVLDLLEVVQPAIYVPDVVYNYNWMDEEIQENAITAYINHVRTLQELVIEQDLDVRLIPTNKGWKYEHFVEYQELYDEFNYEEFAFYAVQYTGGDAGNAIKVLRSHVRNPIAALDLENVFLIGRLAEDDLLDFAPRVRGATGLRQWKDACSTGDGLSQDPWPKFRKNREAKLSVNDGQEQRPVNEFTDKKEEN